MNAKWNMAAGRASVPVVLTLILLNGGCGAGVDATTGLEALLRVAGGQYFAGAIPAESGGPAVEDIVSLNNQVPRGLQNKSLSGRLGVGGQSVALGFLGDTGYWVVPAAAKDLNHPGELDFDLKISLSPALPAGNRDLLLVAVTADGKFGKPATLTLTTQADVPMGDLVLSLTWDRNSDEDLHVLTPSGEEIWAHHFSTYKPPAFGASPPDGGVDIDSSGYLDYDSNAGCLSDGRRMENVIWKKNAPSGSYTVRVDTFSLCGQPVSHWSLIALRGGAVLGEARGTSIDSDAALPHAEGAGVVALQFSIP